MKSAKKFEGRVYIYFSSQKQWRRYGDGGKGFPRGEFLLGKNIKISDEEYYHLCNLINEDDQYRESYSPI